MHERRGTQPHSLFAFPDYSHVILTSEMTTLWVDIDRQAALTALQRSTNVEFPQSFETNMTDRQQVAMCCSIHRTYKGTGTMG